MSDEHVFELGRYWLDRVPGSTNWYRFWYDAGSSEVRRRTLKTGDLAEAKIALAAVVIAEGSGKAEGPENVTLVAVFKRYMDYAGHLPSANMVMRAKALVLDFMGDGATVGEFNKSRQKAFIRNLRKIDYAVGTIISLMIRIKAALNRATKDGDSDDAPEPLLTHVPNVISSPREIAEILNEAEPEPRSWHPDLDMVARFLNGLPEDAEPLRRFIILKVAFACRSAAALEVGPFVLDTRYRLLRLNPPGRRQTKKYRPTLPVPEVLWPVLTSPAWSSAEMFVNHYGKKIRDISSRWNAHRNGLGLPTQLIPHSLRHFMATELRHAHLRYGVERVPEDERERWLGHRRGGMHEIYGTYEPDYLNGAKVAVNAILKSLDEKLDRPFFRQTTAKKSRKIRRGSGLNLLINND